MDGVNLTRWIRVSHPTDAEIVRGSSSAGRLGPWVCGRSAVWASRQLIGETWCKGLHTDFTSVILVAFSGFVWFRESAWVSTTGPLDMRPRGLWLSRPDQIGHTGRAFFTRHSPSWRVSCTPSHPYFHSSIFSLMPRRAKGASRWLKTLEDVDGDTTDVQYTVRKSEERNQKGATWFMTWSPWFVPLWSYYWFVGGRDDDKDAKQWSGRLKTLEGSRV